MVLSNHFNSNGLFLVEPVELGSALVGPEPRVLGVASALVTMVAMVIRVRVTTATTAAALVVTMTVSTTRSAVTMVTGIAVAMARSVNSLGLVVEVASAILVHHSTITVVIVAGIVAAATAHRGRAAWARLVVGLTVIAGAEFVSESVSTAS